MRILDRAGDDVELLHLADTRATAQAWLTSHRYPNAVLDEVLDQDVTPTSVDGRAS